MANKIEIKLDPINICMIAPMGAGKTSILSTLMKYFEDNFINKAKGFSISLNAQDQKLLDDFDTEINTYINAGSFNVETGMLLNPSDTSRKFEFELSLDSKADTKVSQKITIMDYPGGWINETQKNEEFMEHLLNSRILWLPVDTPLLMQTDPNDPQEKAWLQQKLSKDSVLKLVKEWAQYRNDDYQKNDALSCVNFVMTKCETYFSQAPNKDLSKKVKVRFDEQYKSIVQEIHKASPTTEIFYYPVDTIGSVKIIDSEWVNKDGKGFLETKYSIIEPERKIRGCSLLSKSLIDYSVAQINGELKAVDDSADEILNESSWIYKLWNTIIGKSKLAAYQKEEIKKLTPCMRALGEKMKELKESDLEYNHYFQSL